MTVLTIYVFNNWLSMVNAILFWIFPPFECQWTQIIDINLQSTPFTSLMTTALHYDTTRRVSGLSFYWTWIMFFFCHQKIFDTRHYEVILSEWQWCIWHESTCLQHFHLQCHVSPITHQPESGVGHHLHFILLTIWGKVITWDHME